MLNSILGWLEERTGLVSLSRGFLDHPVPGGPRWRHSLGFALAASLLIDLVTGVLLMFTYSPSTSMAWGSVYYITHEVDLGWFIRGVHRYGTYVSVILGGLWLLRLALGGLYRAPREVQWWLGVAGMLLIMVLGVTGNILPWDQRGYWAAVVETTIAGGTPVVGPAIKRVVLGGSEFGNQTLTRIYGLHVVVLPLLLVAIGWAQVRLFNRVGFHGREGNRTEPFWPGQAFRHLVAGLVVLGVVAALTIARHGYSLDAPADPSSDDYPARPEWYFLALYQLLKVFHGRELIATMLIPGGVVTGLLALPLLERALPRRLAHVCSCAFILTLAGCGGYLTYEAMAKDAHGDGFKVAREKADRIAGRAILLAEHDGIPPGGSAYLLKLDPLNRGNDLFEKKCAGCHNLGGAKSPEQWAPDLEGYGSLAWVRGLLENPDSPTYFGKAPQCGGMKEWKEGSKLTAPELEAVASYVASFANIGADLTPAAWADDPKVRDHPGRAPYQKECASCHSLKGIRPDAEKQPLAPDLFAWGSARWTAGLIAAPSSANYYGMLEEEQKMPAFGSQLTGADLATLVRYLKGDYWAGPTSPRK